MVPRSEVERRDAELNGLRLQIETLKADLDAARPLGVRLIERRGPAAKCPHCEKHWVAKIGTDRICLACGKEPTNPF